MAAFSDGGTLTPHFPGAGISYSLLNFPFLALLREQFTSHSLRIDALDVRVGVAVITPSFPSPEIEFSTALEAVDEANWDVKFESLVVATGAVNPLCVDGHLRVTGCVGGSLIIQSVRGSIQ